MSKREYKTNGWIRGESFGEGNQGFTFHAQRSGEDDGDWPYVLKRLKRQGDSHARRRMHIEVATLQTLKHSGVVELIDSNANEFAGNADLYMVTRRVYGSDLQQLVTKSGTTTVEDSARIVLPILKTLEFCHGNRVVHRDIKPCHVILRGDSLDDGVLIDFGLSFNEEVIGGNETELHVGVGNRFIGLPEQQAGASDKRDARSDITQTVGLLFFLLSGITPGFIYDSNSRKPHQRITLTDHCKSASVEQLKQLKRIFDIGFEFDPSRRWQTARAVGEQGQRAH